MRDARTTSAVHPLRFEGAIGATPAAIANGALIINVTRGVNPGGRPRVIERLQAEEGRGLLLGGGDGRQIRARRSNGRPEGKGGTLRGFAHMRSRAQRPRNAGLRFSRQAAWPSALSSVSSSVAKR